MLTNIPIDELCESLFYAYVKEMDKYNSDIIMTNYGQYINVECINKVVVHLCIDDKLDVLKFMIEHYYDYVDMNRQLDMSPDYALVGNILHIYRLQCGNINNDIIKFLLSSFNNIKISIISELLSHYCKKNDSELVIYLLNTYPDIEITSEHINAALYDSDINASVLDIISPLCREQIVLDNCRSVIFYDKIVEYILNHDCIFDNDTNLNNFFNRICVDTPVEYIIAVLNKYPDIDIHHFKELALYNTIYWNNFDGFMFLVNNFNDFNVEHLKLRLEYSCGISNNDMKNLCFEYFPKIF